MTTLRQRVFEVLEQPEGAGRLSRWVDLALILLIAINVCAATLETVPSLYTTYQWVFDRIEIISVAIFTIEYVLRIWVCVDREDYQGQKYPRLSYALSPIALIDLAAILPFFLSVFFALDLRFLRVLRLLRVFKLTRYSTAMTMLLEVFREESKSFFAGFFILFVLLILASSGAYLAEHQVQPDKFGSIPHSMWWAMATLTTVGYGDVTPVTVAGKLFGGMVTIIGVGMAALPAGILASGLADQLKRRRDNLRAQFRTALEDGVICDDEAEELERLRKELGISREVAEQIREDVQNQSGASCPHCGGTLRPTPGTGIG